MSSFRLASTAKLYEMQTGSAPDAAQRERLVQDFVRDEMLFREARRQRLDEGDGLVRRRLIQKIEFLQAEDAAVVPSDDDLRALLASDAARYTSPARVTFEHRYFSPDKAGAEAAREAASAALLASQSGVSPVGDPSPLPLRQAGQSKDDVALAFGRRPIVDALFTATPGVWSGPVESGLGWHLFRVTEVIGARALSFAEARPALLEARQQDLRRRAEAASLETLRTRYRVVRADADSSHRPPINTP